MKNHIKFLLVSFLTICFSAKIITMSNNSHTNNDFGKSMTIEDMKTLVKKHIDAEIRHDVEGVLATLVENPVFEIWPAGLKLQGRENVSAFQREHFNFFFPLIESSTLINEWWTPESACMEYDLFLKAPYKKSYRIIAVLTAKNNLLLGERYYVSEELAQLMSGNAFCLWEKF